MTRDKTQRSSGPIWALAVLALTAAVDSGLSTSWGSGASAIDLWHFRVVGQAASRGAVPDPYSRAGRIALFEEELIPRLRFLSSRGPIRSTREGLALQETVSADPRYLGYAGVETVATPFLYAAFLPLTALDFESAHRVYSLVSLLAFLAGAALLAHSAGFQMAAASLVAGVLGLSFAPLVSDLVVGNVNSLQLALVAVFLALQAKATPRAEIASGAALAFAILLKPNLAFAAVGAALAWWATRQRATAQRTATGAAFALVLGIASAAWLFGTPRIWVRWLGVVPELAGSRRGVQDGNFALSAILGDRHHAAVSILILGLGTAVLLTLALLGRRSGGVTIPDPTLPTRLATGLGALVPLAGARLVWFHYLILVLPLALELIGPAFGRSVPARPRRFLAVAALLLLGTAGQTASELAGGLSARVAACQVAVLALFVTGWLAWRQLTKKTE